MKPSSHGQEVRKRRNAAIVIPWPVAVFLIIIAAMLALLTGWQREMTSRYPVYNLPWVDQSRIEKQVRSGNISRHDAIYYRKKYAESDTTEIR